MPTIAKKKFIFDKRALQAMQHDAKGHAGISFTLKQIQEILDKDVGESAEWLWGDFKGCSYHPDCKGMDTMARDVWFSAIAHHFAGSDWPINGDGELVSRTFFRNLKKGLDKAKVKYS